MKRFVGLLSVLSLLIPGISKAQMSPNTIAYPNTAYGGNTANLSLPATIAPGGLDPAITLRSSTYNVSLGDIMLWSINSVQHKDVGASGGVAGLNSSGQLTNNLNNSSVTTGTITSSSISNSGNATLGSLTLSGPDTSSVLSKQVGTTVLTDTSSGKPGNLIVGYLQANFGLYASYIRTAAADYNSTAQTVTGQGSVYSWNLDNGGGGTWFLNVNPGVAGGFKFYDVPTGKGLYSAGNKLLDLSSNIANFNEWLNAAGVSSTDDIEVKSGKNLDLYSYDNTNEQSLKNDLNNVGITTSNNFDAGSFTTKGNSTVGGNINLSGNINLQANKSIAFTTGAADTNNSIINISWNPSTYRMEFTNQHYGNNWWMNGNFLLSGYFQGSNTSGNQYRISPSVMEGIWGLPDGYLTQGSAISWNQLGTVYNDSMKSFGETDYVNLHGLGTGGFTWCDGKDVTSCANNKLMNLNAGGDLNITRNVNTTGVFASGPIQAGGTVQGIRTYNLSGTTNNNSTILLYNNQPLSTSSCYVPPLHSVASITITVAGNSADNTSQLLQVFTPTVTFHPNAGITVNTGAGTSTYPSVNPPSNGWGVSAAIDSATGCVAVTAYNNNSVTYNWKGTMRVETFQF